MNLPMDLGFESHPHDAHRMVRREAPDTSIAAAAKVQRQLNELHALVLQAIEEDFAGAATAEQVETLGRFVDRAPSTIRKRISELAQMGRLVGDGTRLNSRGLPMTLWRLAGPHDAAPVATVCPPAARTNPATAKALGELAEAASRAIRAGGYEIGERVRIRATRQMAEVYEISPLTQTDPAFAQRIRAGWSTVIDGTIVGRDQWFDGDELERLP